jgi:hypothetical protein
MKTSSVVSSTSSSSSLLKPASPSLDAFFARVSPRKGRLIFALDATASREPMWDTAASLTGKMFDTAASIGALSIQLVFYRGLDECQASPFFTNATALKTSMTKVMCRSGETQIRRILQHALREHAKQAVGAVVFVGDCCEEIPSVLYSTARELTCPMFLFQEGRDPVASDVFRELAHITGGAHARVDHSAIDLLRDLLMAVAAFATGGVEALTRQRSDAAKLLLTQIRK